MDNYSLFRESIKQAAESFKQIDKKETIRIISHIDSDGICSASIIIKALNRDNRKYSLSIMQTLNKDVLEQLAKEDYNYFIFTDLGSGQFLNINTILKNKKILILDHHELDKEQSSDNITHINPHIFNIDGTKEISGSGIVYFFAYYLDNKNQELSHLPIIGSIGDVQENQGFPQLTNEILEKAVELNIIKLKKGIRFFGTQTRPIHKVLEYSTDPFIPGISGSESSAIQFLQQLNINPKKGDGWRKITDLTDDQTKKLTAAIIIKRHSEDNPEDIFGNIYIINHEKEGTLKDAKEFSTLLNACGRLGKPSLGIGACLNDKKTKIRALLILNDYKKEIVNAIKWYNENKNTENIIKGRGYIIINAKSNIPATIIGTLASILSKSNDLTKNTYIMSLAHNEDKTTKVSLRITGYKPRQDIDLKDIISKITQTVDGEAGGHTMAAGAVIQTDKEDQFIEEAKRILEKYSMEEVIA